MIDPVEQAKAEGIRTYVCEDMPPEADPAAFTVDNPTWEQMESLHAFAQEQYDRDMVVTDMETAGLL